MTPSAIQRKTVASKAEGIREMLADIATLPLTSVGDFTADRRMVAAGESYLRRALEGLLDLGRHVLAKGFGKAVPEYAALADELAVRGIVSEDEARRLRLMARYRNRMVHFYDQVTPEELYNILTHERGDLERVLSAILAWLDGHPEVMADPL